MIQAAAVSVVLAFLGLATCGLDAGDVVEKKRDLSDEEAEILRNAPCAMAVGAYFRRLNAPERHGVAVLCGGAHTLQTE